MRRRVFCVSPPYGAYFSCVPDLQEALFTLPSGASFRDGYTSLRQTVGRDPVYFGMPGLCVSGPVFFLSALLLN